MTEDLQQKIMQALLERTPELHDLHHAHVRLDANAANLIAGIAVGQTIDYLAGQLLEGPERPKEKRPFRPPEGEGELDQIRAVMDEFEIGDTDKALHDRLIQWIAQVGSVAITVRAERDEMRAKLRYLRAAAEVFPHCNTDVATNTQIGLPDAEDVWCLGCTIGSAVEYFDREMWDEADAQRWMREYEAAEAARYDAEEAT